MTSPLQSVYSWYRNLIRHPKYRWWVIAATLVYLVSPIDIAPDFLPFIGQIDDAVVITLLLSELAQLLGDRVKATKNRNSQQAENADASPETIEVDAVSSK